MINIHEFPMWVLNYMLWRWVTSTDLVCYSKPSGRKGDEAAPMNEERIPGEESDLLSLIIIDYDFTCGWFQYNCDA